MYQRKKQRPGVMIIDKYCVNTRLFLTYDIAYLALVLDRKGKLLDLQKVGVSEQAIEID